MLTMRHRGGVVIFGALALGLIGIARTDAVAGERVRIVCRDGNEAMVEGSGYKALCDADGEENRTCLFRLDLARFGGNEVSQVTVPVGRRSLSMRMRQWVSEFSVDPPC
jgi:hypothetical protein